MPLCKGSVLVDKIVRLLVELFWVMTQCSVAVGYQRFGEPCCLNMPQHYRASQSRRPRLSFFKIKMN